MTPEFKSVWAALEDGAALAENLRLRSQLMMEISDYVKQSGLTQAKAATVLGTTQPRLNDVLKGRIEKCTVDRLVNMLAAVGFKVTMQINYAA
jgi:predicted XRE-type DNA-binding protein